MQNNLNEFAIFFAKMNWKKIKKLLKKGWHFIWEDDSVASWIVNIVLAFILIKFIIYPGLGWAMGTTHPVVAVVSGSMEHKTVNPCIGYDFQRQCVVRNEGTYELCGVKFSEKQRVDLDFFWETCGEFYEERDISSEEFKDFTFKNGFNTGDIIILRGKKTEDLDVGDVIVFQATQPYPIIHRVVEKRYENGKIIFETKGDHNSKQTLDDLDIGEERIIGQAIIRIPYLGWIKIWFFKLLDMVGIMKLASLILN
jgi:signal peptidase I